MLRQAGMLIELVPSRLMSQASEAMAVTLSVQLGQHAAYAPAAHGLNGWDRQGDDFAL